jgi:hypothetical protein
LSSLSTNILISWYEVNFVTSLRGKLIARARHLDPAAFRILSTSLIPEIPRPLASPTPQLAKIIVLSLVFSSFSICIVSLFPAARIAAAHTPKMILRRQSLHLSIVVGFLLLVALLGNAKGVNVHQTTFRHPPKKFFYFDDSSVHSILNNIDGRYYSTMRVALFIVPMMTE